MLHIDDLTVKKEEDTILNGLTLTVSPGERVLLMGPNGSGKTSLARTILGDPSYEVVSGRMAFRPRSGPERPSCLENDLDLESSSRPCGNQKKSSHGNAGNKTEWLDLLGMSPQERARAGFFVGYQHPVSIPGVHSYTFLYTAYREIYSDKTKQMDHVAFEKQLNATAQMLDMSGDLLGRGVNEGFSGGERKKLELLQMLVLSPAYVVLDEPDSGLDADTVKLVKKAVELLPVDTAVLLISHDPSRLGIPSFDRIYVMKKGSIVQEGGQEIIEHVKSNGYE